MSLTHGHQVVTGERKPFMPDCRKIMDLLIQGNSYRQIQALAGCSHRAISKANRVLDEQ